MESREENLHSYLNSWGLREFRDESSYYAWQKAMLSQDELQAVNRIVENRHGGKQKNEDIEFYDFLARAHVVPILYSQRIDYFFKVGLQLSERVPPASQVLDFGCGVGILTIFLAQQYPDVKFVGIDRSPHSIDCARREAENRHVGNIRFEVKHIPGDSLTGTYDLILSTQALFQSEQEPGLPSMNWQTFDRAIDPERQGTFEKQTGLHDRLNALLSVMGSSGRMLLFEKTWNLGRRILFQRALKARGLVLVSPPTPCSYRLVDTLVMDGPLYEVQRSQDGSSLEWTEDLYRGQADSIYRCVGLIVDKIRQELMSELCGGIVSGNHAELGAWTFRVGQWNHALVCAILECSHGFQAAVVGGLEDKVMLVQLIETVKHLQESELAQLIHDFWGTELNPPPDDSTPFYENHHASAQAIFEALPWKTIEQEQTTSDGIGREKHIEMGTTKNLKYLYWANTFDQRQLVLMGSAKSDNLREYFQESLEEEQLGPSSHPPSL